MRWILRRIEQGTDKAKRRELYAAVNAGNDGTVAGSAFFGPKETGLLDRYGYEKTLQFGMFGVIARFLLVVLLWLNQTIHNYGWAIIVLTIIIKIVLYPLLSLVAPGGYSPFWRLLGSNARSSRSNRSTRRRAAMPINGRK